MQATDRKLWWSAYMDSSRRAFQAHRWLPEESHKHLGGLRTLGSNMRMAAAAGPCCICHGSCLPSVVQQADSWDARLRLAAGLKRAPPPVGLLTVTEPLQLTMTYCALQIVKVFEQILYAADEREAKEVGMAPIPATRKQIGVR